MNSLFHWHEQLQNAGRFAVKFCFCAAEEQDFSLVTRAVSSELVKTIDMTPRENFQSSIAPCSSTRDTEAWLQSVTAFQVIVFVEYNSLSEQNSTSEPHS